MKKITNTETGEVLAEVPDRYDVIVPPKRGDKCANASCVQYRDEDEGNLFPEFCTVHAGIAYNLMVGEIVDEAKRRYGEF